MMNREEFKAFAAGSFVLGKPSIDVGEMNKYVDGAIMAFDWIAKKRREEKEKANEHYEKKHRDWANDTGSEKGEGPHPS
jgi:hypothetical protein